MVTLEQARDVASAAFNASPPTLYKKRCRSCFSLWEKNGFKKEDKPPLFPESYIGNCPMCGQQLSKPSLNF